MTLEEFNIELDILKSKHQREVYLLVEKCALSNNTYNVGDVVEDHIGKVKVDKIKTSTDYGKPICIYRGLELKKDGTPTKKGSIREVWQGNLLKK